MNETPRDLARLLAKDALAVCQELLPNGKLIGSDWVVGDVSGAAGKSLKICVKGDRIGKYYDHADPNYKGDLMGLWCEVRGIGIGPAMREVKAHLGINEIEPYRPPTKTYSRPKPNPARRTAVKHPDSPVVAYLKSRGITEETLAAFQIGMMAGHEPPFHNLPNNPGTIAFPSFRIHPDGAKELISIKYLALYREVKDGKEHKFTQLSDRNLESVLFGWQAMNPNTRRVAICEGEPDCLTLHQWGISSLSVPMGGGGGEKQKWVENEYPYLERFDEIFLCMDMDKAGNEAAMELVQRLGRHRCRIVKLPHKDANECLMQGVTREEIDQCFENSTFLSPEKLKFARDFADQAKALGNPVNTAALGLSLPWPHTFAANKFSFRPGELTVWSGYSGHGKTTLLNYVMVHGMQNSEVICTASLEISGGATVLKLSRQIVCQEQPTNVEIDRAVQWMGDQMCIYDQLGDSPLQDMLDVFLYARRRYGASQLVIDSLMMLDIADDDHNKQSVVAKTLLKLAREWNCHIHLVAHPRKAKDSSQQAGMNDVAGRANITNTADNVLLVWKNKKKIDAKRDEQLRGTPIPYDLQYEPDAVLTIDKCRTTGWTASIPLWFHDASCQFLSSDGASPVTYSPTPVAPAPAPAAQSAGAEWI